MILITRPYEEAKILKNELSKYGFESVLDPLISFKILFKKIEYNENYYYLVSSVQTVRALSKFKKKHELVLSDGNFLVIGKKVLRELKNLKKIKIKKVTENSDEMFNYLKKNSHLLRQRKAIIYLSGSIINKDFLKKLKSKKILVKRKILYKVLSQKNLKRKTISLLRNHKIKKIVLFSSHTAQIFINHIKSEKLKDYVTDIKIYALSKRIKVVVKKSGFFSKINTANQPNQLSMIRQIKSQN